MKLLNTPLGLLFNAVTLADLALAGMAPSGSLENDTLKCGSVCSTAALYSARR
jgi:hypothetical protein